MKTILLASVFVAMSASHLYSTVLTATTSQTNITCNGACNGSAVVLPSGGFGNYTYLWMPSAGTNALASDLCSGIYTCIITDESGASIEKSVIIKEPGSLNATFSETPMSCNGNSSVSTLVSISGGVPPYTYSWNTDTIDPSFSGEVALPCVITDAKGCSLQSYMTVKMPLPVVTVVSPSDATYHNALNGSATVEVSGNAVPYSYIWDSGETTSTITGLAAGTYNCIVVDANGCSFTESMTIAEPDMLTIAASQTNVRCNGGSNATASVNVTGGVQPYLYNWDAVNATDATANGLRPGQYICTVTDASGFSADATFIITEPTPLSTITSSTNVSCNGGSNGSVSVSVNGGTSPYSWDYGDVRNSADRLSAAYYVFTIFDANGCSMNTDALVVEPQPLIASSSQIDVTCNGGSNGSASMNVTGGTQPYTYNWSNGTGNASINSSGAGEYNCIITDANGCSTVQSITLTEPGAVMASLSYTDAIGDQANGSASILVYNGIAPYSYNWSSGSVDNFADALAAGSYNCTVTDAHNCSASYDFTINSIMELVSSNPVSGEVTLHATPIISKNTIAGIAEEVKNKQAKAFPNPAAAFVTIDLNAFENSTVTVKIMNAIGDVLKQDQTTETKHTIELNDFSNGIYFIQVLSDGYSNTQQLIVQH